MENIKRITITDFHRMETAARQAVENIPDGHCRIKEEAYNRKLLNLCENAKTRTDGKIKYIIVVESYNQGNARYPHSIKKVSMYSVGKFAKETKIICDSLIGKSIIYWGMIGKIKVVSERNGNKEYGFFKKYARSKYYHISYVDILAMNMEKE